MLLKRLFWFLSFSVFLAGLIYYFTSYDNALKKPRSNAGLTGEVFIRGHRPDERLVPGLIARHATFWYLTGADRTVISDILNGTSLASWTEPVEVGPFLQAELSPAAGLGPDLKARAAPGGAGGPDEEGMPVRIDRK